jgi:hypothetical protein
MHCIYTDQARADADLEAVNAAFAASRHPGDVTSRWADIVPCAEGWAFPEPPAPLNALCTPDFVSNSITII